jgi:hypothetical protein
MEDEVVLRIQKVGDKYDMEMKHTDRNGGHFYYARTGSYSHPSQIVEMIYNGNIKWGTKDIN